MDVEKFAFPATQLAALFSSLHQDGYEVLGPTLRDGAIVYDSLSSIDDLPRGWRDDQEKGRYRLVRREDNAYFGFSSGPQSWKPFLFAPREKLFSARKTEAGIRIDEMEPLPSKPTKRAFLGVRACDLAAIRIQDRIFLEGTYKDEHYERRRENVMIIAVNCTGAGKTCFCVSMKTGPRVRGDVDLVLTEVLNERDHYFVAEPGSPAGERLVRQLSPLRAVTDQDLQEAEIAMARAVAEQGRTLNTDGIKELLYSTLEHPRWDEVAQRCLSCANCTLVCPTCFCSTVEDVTDLKGENTDRWRNWDSCFNLGHSYIHGGSVHGSVKSRYRQWLTHKLGSWIDQFGMSGCVGCGRCIAWCPVGIDLTEEAEALRQGGGK
jgi:sulfhydrogenase subunit beta (sulfur reductase)